VQTASRSIMTVLTITIVAMEMIGMTTLVTRVRSSRLRMHDSGSSRCQVGQASPARVLGLCEAR
jgi:hypothetical protein